MQNNNFENFIEDPTNGSRISIGEQQFDNVNGVFRYHRQQRQSAVYFRPSSMQRCPLPHLPPAQLLSTASQQASDYSRQTHQQQKQPIPVSQAVHATMSNVLEQRLHPHPTSFPHQHHVPLGSSEQRHLNSGYTQQQCIPLKQEHCQNVLCPASRYTGTQEQTQHQQYASSQQQQNFGCVISGMPGQQQTQPNSSDFPQQFPIFAASSLQQQPQTMQPSSSGFSHQNAILEISEQQHGPSQHSQNTVYAITSSSQIQLQEVEVHNMPQVPQTQTMNPYSSGFSRQNPILQQYAPSQQPQNVYATSSSSQQQPHTMQPISSGLSQQNAISGQQYAPSQQSRNSGYAPSLSSQIQLQEVEVHNMPKVTQPQTMHPNWSGFPQQNPILQQHAPSQQPQNVYATSSSSQQQPRTMQQSSSGFSQQNAILGISGQQYAPLQQFQKAAYDTSSSSQKQQPQKAVCVVLPRRRQNQKNKNKN